jgi:hypothetical protein
MFSGLQRILPAQARKAREIAIGGANYRAMFDRECGQMCICHEITSGLRINDQSLKQSPMSLSWVDENGARSLQQARDNPRCLIYRECLRERSWVCANPHECEQGHPRKTHALRAI